MHLIFLSAKLAWLIVSARLKYTVIPPFFLIVGVIHTGERWSMNSACFVWFALRHLVCCPGNVKPHKSTIFLQASLCLKWSPCCSCCLIECETPCPTLQLWWFCNIAKQSEGNTLISHCVDPTKTLKRDLGESLDMKLSSHRTGINFHLDVVGQSVVPTRSFQTYSTLYHNLESRRTDAWTSSFEILTFIPTLRILLQTASMFSGLFVCCAPGLQLETRKLDSSAYLPAVNLTDYR